MATDERLKQLAADTVKETGMALLVATTLHQPAPSGYSRDQGGWCQSARVTETQDRKSE